MTIIAGNTYPVKDQLKALGGKWDATRKAWLVPDAQAEAAKALVAGAGTAKRRSEPVSVDGHKAIMGRHWSTRGHGPMERLCAGGCGRRVKASYAECYSCHRESLDAL